MTEGRGVYRGAAHPESRALVGIVVGSRVDAERFEPALALFDRLAVPWEMALASAHRTPDRVVAWAKSAKARGLRVVIAAAGGAAQLPALIAAQTPLPVLGVPMPSTPLAGADVLLSVVSMPEGSPIACFPIGEAGAANAALFTLRMLALDDDGVASRLARHRLEQEHGVLSSDDDLQAALRERTVAQPRCAAK